MSKLLKIKLMNRYLYWDSEYSNTGEKKLRPVCFAFELEGQQKKVWNVEGENLNATQNFFNKVKKEEIVLVAFSVLAEARYLISLGIDPTQFNWIDLKVEYEQLLNSNHAFEYGRHLDQNGKVVTTKPPRNKYHRTDEEDEEEQTSRRAKRTLLACTYKMLNVLETSVEHKNEMRDLCIKYDIEKLNQNKNKIMDYCLSDVKNLTLIHERINDEILKRLEITHDILENIQIERGNYVALAAIREARGYPVDVKSLTNVANKIEDIVKDLQEDINVQFETFKMFTWVKKDKRYKANQKEIKNFIRENKPDWPTTAKGQVSLSKKSFEAYKDYKYDYPRGDLFAQYSRFLSFNTSLNGVRKKASFKVGDETIFNSIGSDDRCRPYAPPYNSQTSRTYPKATSFIPAKAAWMRSLIRPKSGNVCYGIDYASQEFLLGAIESMDENMFQAYVSGDPYIWLAVKSGSAPQGATKESHGFIRDVFKTLTLAIGFGMGANSLAKSLSNSTGREWKEMEATNLINIYFDIYDAYGDYRQEIYKKYKKDGYLMLRDGWVLFGDNPSPNSILNFPFQGGAAAIMRLTEKIKSDKVKTIYTLHDALYGIQKSF
jgi:DNA polymerase I